VSKPELVVDGPRGPLLLYNAPELEELADTPGVTTYEMMRYLDTGELRCVICHEGTVAVFPSNLPGVHGELLATIEGETEPRAIARRLGIPEDHLFPDRG